jgi:hypothetical protein
MIQARICDDFKGATTLLLWGDREGMASLLDDFSALCTGKRNAFVIDGPDGDLTVCLTSQKDGSSTLTMKANGLRWDCSRQTVALAADLVEPLLRGAGHQYLDANGLAEQIIIARDEYPADLG